MSDEVHGTADKNNIQELLVYANECIGKKINMNSISIPNDT